MGIDILCLGFVLILFVFGLFRGLLSQILRIGALIGAYFLATPASPYIKPVLTTLVKGEGLFVDLISLFIAWVGCYFGIVLAGTVLIKLVRGTSRSLKSMDRLLGGLLGGIKGCLIVYVIVSGLILLNAPLNNIIPEKYIDPKDSQVVAFVEEFNLFSMIGMPNVEKLGDLAVVWNDKDKNQLLKDYPALKNIEANPAFQQLMDDKAFEKAVYEKRFDDILKNRNFQKLINDPAIRKLLSGIDLDAISKEIETKMSDR